MTASARSGDIGATGRGACCPPRRDPAIRTPARLAATLNTRTRMDPPAATVYRRDIDRVRARRRTIVHEDDITWSASHPIQSLLLTVPTTISDSAVETVNQIASSVATSVSPIHKAT